jgi:hypothetical protein
MYLKLITITTTVKILMSVRHTKIIVNMILHSLQLIVKIIATMPRNRTNNNDVIDFDQHMDVISKMLVFKIGSD